MGILSALVKGVKAIAKGIKALGKAGKTVAKAVGKAVKTAGRKVGDLVKRASQTRAYEATKKASNKIKDEIIDQIKKELFGSAGGDVNKILNLFKKGGDIYKKLDDIIDLRWKLKDIEEELAKDAAEEAEDAFWDEAVTSRPGEKKEEKEEVKEDEKEDTSEIDEEKDADDDIFSEDYDKIEDDFDVNDLDEETLDELLVFDYDEIVNDGGYDTLNRIAPGIVDNVRHNGYGGSPPPGFFSDIWDPDDLMTVWPIDLVTDIIYTFRSAYGKTYLKKDGNEI